MCAVGPWVSFMALPFSSSKCTVMMDRLFTIAVLLLSIFTVCVFVEREQLNDFLCVGAISLM